MIWPVQKTALVRLVIVGIIAATIGLFAGRHTSVPPQPPRLITNEYIILDLASGATFPFSDIPLGAASDARLRDTWMLFKRVDRTDAPVPQKAKRIPDFAVRKQVDERIHSTFFLAISPATPEQLAWIRSPYQNLTRVATISPDEALGSEKGPGLAALYRQTRNPCLVIPTLIQLKAGLAASITPTSQALSPIPTAPSSATIPFTFLHDPEMTAEGHAITWDNDRQGHYEAAPPPHQPLAIRFALVAPNGHNADDLPPITYAHTDGSMPELLAPPVFGRVSATFNDRPDLKTRWVINPWSPGHIATHYTASTLRHNQKHEEFQSVLLDDKNAIDLTLPDDHWADSLPVVAVAPGTFITLDQADDQEVHLPDDYTLCPFDNIRRHDFGVVLLDHGGFFSAYAHMKAITVNPGDHVESGQAIGRISHVHPETTSNHIHFCWYKAIRRPSISGDHLQATLELRALPCRFTPRSFTLEIQQDDGTWSSNPIIHVRKSKPYTLVARTDIPDLPRPLPPEYLATNQLSFVDVESTNKIKINGSTMTPLADSGEIDLSLYFSGEKITIHVIIIP